MQRGKASGLDGCLVHVRRAKVGHLARSGSARRSARLVEKLRHAMSRELLDLVACVPAILSRRNRGGPEPDAVRVSEEIVAWPDVLVHAAFDRRRRPI